MEQSLPAFYLQTTESTFQEVWGQELVAVLAGLQNFQLKNQVWISTVKERVASKHTQLHPEEAGTGRDLTAYSDAGVQAEPPDKRTQFLQDVIPLISKSFKCYVNPVRRSVAHAEFSLPPSFIDLGEKQVKSERVSQWP